ncbi:DUF5681 domain-containing protein [Shinella sp.]|uniref:DUF5681 domain-containing protein n=1 Tax=Shinella sp. TaxID=1870904 RepID=UPI003F725C65
MSEEDDASYDPADEKPTAYQVGYGKPPMATRFTPGRSGNSKGRPRAAKSISTIVRDALFEKIEIRTLRGTKKIPKIEAVALQSINKALKGDPKAAEQIFKLAREAGLVDRPLPEVDVDRSRQLSEEDAAILARFFPAPAPPDGDAT